MYIYHTDTEYYYPMNISIDSVAVSAPDSFYIFKGNTKISKYKNDINLTFVSKNYVYKDSIVLKNTKINFYILRKVQKDSTYCQTKRDIANALCKLSQYTKVKKKLDIIIVNCHTNNFRFGTGFGSHAVLDAGFNSQDIVHEILHLYFENNVENGTHGELFVKESIIEWLAYYLTSNFTYFSKQKLSRDSISLYDLRVNDTETYRTVYNSGPAILSAIASETSQETIAKAIISFLEFNNGRQINYQDFLFYLKKYLPKAEIRKMDCMIKGTLSIIV